MSSVHDLSHSATLLDRLHLLRGESNGHRAQRAIRQTSDAVTYPFTPTYQKKLLALLLSDRRILPQIAPLIQASHFTTPLYRDTAAVLLDLWQGHGVVPSPETLRAAVEEQISRRGTRLPKEIPEQWRSLIDDLAQERVTDGKIVLGQVLNWIQDQVFRQALIECSALVDQADRTGERDYAKARKILSDALAVGIDRTLNTLDYFDSARMRVARLALGDGEIGRRIPLALAAIEAVLEGGPSREEMIVWAAPTGRGKTYCLTWTTKAALYQGKRVALFTAEMSKDALARRVDRSVCNFTVHEMKDNPSLAIRRIESVSAYRGQLFITELYGKNATVERINVTLEQHQAETGFIPDVILVDYPGMMKGSQRFTEKRHEWAEIYRDLRALGKQWDAVMHVPIQTNKGSLARKIITIRDLAECFEVAWHADVILALCQTPDEERENLVRLFVAKNREGIDHYAAPFQFDKRTGNFVGMGEAALATDQSLRVAIEEQAATAGGAVTS